MLQKRGNVAVQLYQFGNRDVPPGTCLKGEVLRYENHTGDKFLGNYAAGLRPDSGAARRARTRAKYEHDAERPVNTERRGEYAVKQTDYDYYAAEPADDDFKPNHDHYDSQTCGDNQYQRADSKWN